MDWRATKYLLSDSDTLTPSGEFDVCLFVNSLHPFLQVEETLYKIRHSHRALFIVFAVASSCIFWSQMSAVDDGLYI